MFFARQCGVSGLWMKNALCSPACPEVGASSNRAPAYPKRIAPRLIDLVVSCVSLTKRIHENLMAGFCGCVQVRCDPLVLFNEIGGHED